MSEQRKKILHLITDLDRGGAETLLIDFAAETQKAGWDVEVAYLEGEAPLARTFQEKDIPVHHAKSFYGLFHLIRRHRYSLIHTHLIRADVYGIIAAKLLGIKVISTKHNTHYFYNKHRFWMIIDGWLNRCADKIVCVSNAVREYYIAEEKLSPQSLEVIYNGIDILHFKNYPRSNTFREQHCISSNAKIIVTIASFTPQKGYHYLLEAARKLIEEDPRIHFVWVGEGPLWRAYQGKIQELHLEQRIILAGIMDDVRPALAASDVFVLPSLWEGFGLVLLEAMAMGLPIVASRVGGIPEILADETYAQLVEPGDMQELCHAMKNKINGDKLGKVSYKNLEPFSIEAMIKKYMACYERATHDGSKNIYHSSCL